MQSSRNEFDEQAVRQQNTLLGESSQNVDSLTSLQSYFDITGNSGIPSALNSLFQAFSAWGQTPPTPTPGRPSSTTPAPWPALFRICQWSCQVTQNTGIQLSRL